MDVMKVAKLARLRLTPEEAARYGKELEAILEYVKDLETIPVGAAHSEGAAPMREDVPGPLNAQPPTIAVPKVIE